MANNKQCISRLQKEYKTLLREPVPHISAHPTPTNLLEWHFVLEGDKDTDYATGVYHGKIVFPPQYPFKPPSLSLYTPNGRFATNTKLCLSMTDYHPESWNPMWSVGTILTGLLSFMHDTVSTTGAISSTPQEKRKLASESLAFNIKNPMFRKLFPEWVEEVNSRQQRAATAATAAAGGGGDATPNGAAVQGQQGGADAVAVGQLDPSRDGAANGWAAQAGAGRPPGHELQGGGEAGRRLGGGGVPVGKHHNPLGPKVTSGLWTAAMVMAVVVLAAAPLLNWSTVARHARM